MLIRKEQPGDEDAIRSVTARAFRETRFSRGLEPLIIDALREAGELTLSLVVLLGDVIIGQISFSPVTIDAEFDHWFGLGPIAVEPAHQRSGIGSALVNEGLAQMKRAEAKGIVLVGSPAYYGRFGFKGDAGIAYGSVDRAYVQRLTLVGADPQGTVRYCDSFEAAAAGQA